MNFYGYENHSTEQLHAILEGTDVSTLTMKDLQTALLILCRRVIDLEVAVAKGDEG